MLPNFNEIVVSTVTEWLSLIKRLVKTNYI